MNRRALFRGAAALVMIGLAGLAAAADKSTPADAEALVKKAAAYIKANGADKAYEEFTNGKAFKDRELYIFVYDFHGKCLAHGANPKLVGKDLIGLKDPDGKPLVQMLVDVAKNKGQGWTDSVKFRNPTTDKIQTRVNYVERFGDVAIGSGVYKD